MADRNEHYRAWVKRSYGTKHITIYMDGTKINDDSLLALSTFKQLELLDISRTNVTLQRLKGVLQRLPINDKQKEPHALRLIILQTPAAKNREDNPALSKEFNATYPDYILDF